MAAHALIPRKGGGRQPPLRLLSRCVQTIPYVLAALAGVAMYPRPAAAHSGPVAYATGPDLRAD
eukprot:12528023-Alexandrium_andersonii.AAC.1